MFSIASTFAVFVLTLLFVYNWQKHRYWKPRGVPTPPFWPLIGHQHLNFFGKRWENIDKIYKEFKSNGLWGMYETTKPLCYVCDPVYIREVLVKEADHFIDRRPLSFGKGEKIFSEMLIFLRGEKWKALRSLVTPTFTSGKIKGMFPLIDEKVRDFISECEKEMRENFYVEMKTFFGYYTMDVIGTCAFGIDAHCIQQKEESPFIKHAKEFSTFFFTKLLKFLFLRIFPKLYKVSGFQFHNSSSVRFFSDVVEESVALRRKSGVKRDDFLDLMLEALEESERKGDHFKYTMTLNTVISQSVLFIRAGSDPTTDTLAFMAYLLAKNPEAQDKLRKELQKIVEVDGKLNYQNVMEAHYLDACLSETLRIFSPAQFAERCCTKSFTLPGTDVRIPENMIVDIPIWSLHMDPEYWEEPLSFRPERFLPENKDNVNHYAYLPFGLGPRNCLGMRFAQMEVKLAMARLCLCFEMNLRPGFTEVGLKKTLGTLRPNSDGVQLILNKITSSDSLQS